MKVTQWFESNNMPKRIGVYQRLFPPASSYPENILFSFWDGNTWYFGGINSCRAFGHFYENEISVSQEIPWRGIAR